MNRDMLFVIPMKDPERAKSRLQPILSQPVRKKLALALFRQTIDFIRASRDDADILVVTGSREIAGLAATLGVEVLAEEGVTHLSEAVEQAARHAEDQGYRSICVLPADLANPQGYDLERLLSATHDAPSVILCPAHDGGTNALVATPPRVIPFRYGYRSCTSHEQEAARAGVTCTVLRLESLAHDIDVANDLYLHLAPSINQLLDAELP